MKITDYIRGDRRGREANGFERQAMDDPFLSDAIEGYDAVYGDHPGTVKRLEEWVQARSAKRIRSRRRIVWGVSAAAAVLIAGAGIIYYNSGGGAIPRASSALLADVGDETRTAEPGTPAVTEHSTASASGHSASPASDTDSPVSVAGRARSMPPQGEPAADTVSARTETAAPSAVSEPAASATKESGINPVKEAATAEKETGTDPEKEMSVSASPATARIAAARSAEPEIVITRSQVAPDESIDTVYNESFIKYFAENRRPKTDENGNPQSGEITIEFRVNAAGVPSAIRVLSSFSREANREVIEMLVEGPRWEPTHERRIRTIVEYE